MLRAFVLLVLAQFVGEAGARLLSLPVPGPVLGLALTALAAGLSPRLLQVIEPAADPLLRHLSLLFVPAGVGVLQHLGLLRRELVPILAVLLLSTLVTLAITALSFAALTRTKRPAEGGEG
jgi:holin-like protein